MRHQIPDEKTDQVADHLVFLPFSRDAGVFPAYLLAHLPPEENSLKVILFQVLRLQSVIDVMVVVSDLVGQSDDLSLQGGGEIRGELLRDFPRVALAAE